MDSRATSHPDAYASILQTISNDCISLYLLVNDSSKKFVSNVDNATLLNQHPYRTLFLSLCVC